MAWTITGESHNYKPETGAYGGISPEYPVDLKEGGLGAWELAARVSYVN
ncbi:porin, partial [Vibrio parahaemolyticus]